VSCAGMQGGSTMFVTKCEKRDISVRLKLVFDRIIKLLNEKHSSV
jgi:hypothetical protein